MSLGQNHNLLLQRLPQSLSLNLAAINHLPVIEHKPSHRLVTEPFRDQRLINDIHKRIETHLKALSNNYLKTTLYKERKTINLITK